MSLISVLVAIVIFALGMLSIASVYSLAVPAQTSNEVAIDSAALGNQFWGLLQADPGLVGQIGTSAAVSYTSATAATAPASLQFWLANVFNNPQTRLPNAQVTITPGQGAEGNPCTAPSPTTTLCGVTLNIQWNPGNGVRSQTYNYQVGF